MKKRKNILLGAFLLTATLGMATTPVQIAAKEKKNTATTEISAPEAVTIRPGNVFVITDSKDLQNVINSLQQKADKKVTVREEEKTVATPSGLLGALGINFEQLFEKLSKVEAFSLENIYFLLGGLFLTFLAVVLLRRFIDNFIIRRLTSRSETDLDDKLCSALRPPIELAIYSAGIYLSMLKILLNLPPQFIANAGKGCNALLAASVAWALYRSVAIFAEWIGRYADRSDGKIDSLIVMLLQKTLKVGIIVISVLFIGQNVLGMNLTTLLAGAGIFGLAMAFAAQETIANVFGSIIIVLDKPFFVGDRIKVEGVDGTVKSVGFRSTKMETLDGFMITLPNKKLTESIVENISKRPYIKFVANLGLVYGTTPEQMEQAITILHEIYDNHEGLNAEKPPLIFFNSFNDWSLNIQVISWYHPADWQKAMTWNSGRNLETLRRFNAAGLNFAFPTNTTYLANDSDKPLQVGVTSRTT